MDTKKTHRLGSAARHAKQVRCSHRGAFPKWLAIGLSVVAVLVALPAHAQIRDPLEPVNRTIDRGNLLFVALMSPTLYIWSKAVPTPVKYGVQNVNRNLGRPLSVVSSLLQADIENAGLNFTAFWTNTLFGGFGLIDIGGRIGIDDRREDLGQVLAVWGFGEGIYLVLPLLGPNNLRDTIGLGLSFTLPLNSNIYGADVPPDMGLGFTAAAQLDNVASNSATLVDIYRNSLDAYSSIKSLYEQNLAQEIYNGNPPVEAVSD
nr:VacJ family lipoprotein [Alphaproteobacteria bacterium]